MKLKVYTKPVLEVKENKEDKKFIPNQCWESYRMIIIDFSKKQKYDYYTRIRERESL